MCYIMNEHTAAHNRDHIVETRYEFLQCVKRGPVSLEAQFVDFLSIEFVQALVHSSHDTVLLRFL